MSRKQSREIVLRMVFHLTANDYDEADFEKLLGLACDGNMPAGPELEYITSLYTATVSNLDSIDEMIKKHSKGFALDRIFKTDLTALRMCIAEIKFFDKTPAIVAINEAVELAKKYGTEKSGGFVNGILAAVIK